MHALQVSFPEQAPAARPLMSAADLVFVRAVTRVRSLGEMGLGRPPTDEERKEADRERGRIAASRGMRLRGCESISFVIGHARGMIEARGEG